MPSGCMNAGSRGRHRVFLLYTWMCVETELLETVATGQLGSHIHKKVLLPLFLKLGDLVICPP